MEKATDELLRRGQLVKGGLHNVKTRGQGGPGGKTMAAHLAKIKKAAIKPSPPVHNLSQDRHAP